MPAMQTHSPLSSPTRSSPRVKISALEFCEGEADDCMYHRSGLFPTILNKNLLKRSNMFPSCQAFRTFEEFQKTVQLCIPPYNFSIHSLHFHNQMTITNRTIRHPISRVLPEPKMENPIRDNSVRFDPHSAGVVARAFPEKQHNQSHGAAENVMGVNFGGGNGGDGLGPQELFLLMDGFDESGSEEGRSSQQKKEPENSVESLSPAAKRHRRMIKNRESAARSRARKQAYTTQLEIEVAQLRKENELLRKAKRVFRDVPIAVTRRPRNRKAAARTISAAF